MWPDSTIVLQWINSTNKHPIFIANRVSEILENTSVDQWNHVAACDNLADAGTRGRSAEVLQSSSWVTEGVVTSWGPLKSSAEGVLTS